MPNTGVIRWHHAVLFGNRVVKQIQSGNHTARRTFGAPGAALQPGCQSPRISGLLQGSAGGGHRFRRITFYKIPCYGINVLVLANRS